MLGNKLSDKTKQEYWKLKTNIRNMFRRLVRFPEKTYRNIKRLCWRISVKTGTFFRKFGALIKKAFRFAGRLLKKTTRREAIETLQLEIQRKRLFELRNRQYRKGFLENLKPVLDQMPESNGSRYYEKLKSRIAIIADEFLYDSYKDIADFVYITPETYRDHIEDVDFLLVASAWRGLNNEWRLMATEGTATNLVLHEVIDAYHKAGKQIVFYSKEDPPNYDHFLAIAKRCDIIFTSCAEKVDDYKRDCGTEHVHVMEFCINPEFHNPIGVCNANRSNGVLFAGSWMRRYPDRIKSMEIMLDGVLKSGTELVIADRNFSQDRITYFFPEKYFPYISREIPHDYLQKLHKLYNWAININSITESRTMFANRVYELQANGCLMISNRSIGVQEKFEEVIIVNSEEDVEKVFKKYSAEEVYAHQMAGVRRVMTGETNYDRISNLLGILGYPVEKQERIVLVIADGITPELRTQFESQTYKNKYLISKCDLTMDQYERADIVTRWNMGSQYGKFYLEDMVNAYKYTACDYIVKDCYRKAGVLTGTVQHDYVDHISNVYAMLAWREAVDMDTFLRLEDGCKVDSAYSIDYFNYESSV